MPEIWRKTASILIAESKCSPFLSSSGSIKRKGRIRCNRASERVKALFHTPRIANKKRRTLNFQRRNLELRRGAAKGAGEGRGYFRSDYLLRRFVGSRFFGW